VSGKISKVVHLKKRACVINTRYGEIQLDEVGKVTNLDDLECTADELCELPNFVDERIFGGRPEAAPVKEAREKAEEKVKKTAGPSGPSDEEYGAFIAELIESGAECTGEGYIQMDVLNAALREKEMPIVSGTRRKEISDAYNAEE